MKKFSKMLALGLAAVLVFGMTAQAEGSSNTENNKPVVEGESYPEGVIPNVVDDTEKATVTATVTTDAVKQQVKTAMGNDGRKQNVMGVVDITIPKGETVTVTVAVPGVLQHHTIAVAHLSDDGKTVIEVLKGVCNKDGFVTFTVTGGSPFAIIRVGDDSEITTAPADSTTTTTPGTAPKTGETVPVAGVLAVLFMAGVIVCANKVRYNK